MTTRKTVFVAVLVTVIHFVLTSIAWQYVGTEIGSQTGLIVARHLIEAYEDNATDVDAHTRATNAVAAMKRESDAVTEPWEPLMAILSFPVRPLLRLLESQIVWRLADAAMAKNISHQGFYTGMTLLSLGASLVNSLALGLLLFLGLGIINRFQARLIASEAGDNSPR